MDAYQQLVEKIIKEQENIIGPLAVEQANKVQGLTVDLQKHEITFDGNKTQILEKLVDQYKTLFGQASVEVCREAASTFMESIPQDQLPQTLRSS